MTYLSFDYDPKQGSLLDTISQLNINGDALLSCRWAMEQYWLDEQPSKPLFALMAYINQRIQYICISEQSFNNELVQKLLNNLHDLQTWQSCAHSIEQPLIDFNQALLLDPVTIAKPWGEEIWFTGIEKRGLSKIQDEQYHQPIPYFLSLFGQDCLVDKQLILLKILAPLNKENIGDLYFELHEEKREVYVVTDVDSQAWPQGEGGIRFGFDQTKREEFENDTAFYNAYLKAVTNYYQIREHIDFCLAEDQVIAEDDVIQEKQLRKKMMDFIAVLPISVGDVISVPPLLPHGLLHGVEVVEFQTPVYERKILSFGQKVLTQDTWDTEEALQLFQQSPWMKQEYTTQFSKISEDDAYCLERIVEFDDFTVLRLNTFETFQYAFDQSFPYALVMVVSGEAHCDNQQSPIENAITILPKQAVLCSGIQSVDCVIAQANSTVLIAYPLT